MEISTLIPATVQKLFDDVFCTMLAFDDAGVVTYINETGKKETGHKEFEVNIQEVLPSLFGQLSDIEGIMAQMEGKEMSAAVYRKNCTCFNADVKAVRIQQQEDYGINVVSLLNKQYEVYARQEIERVENTMKETMKARNEFVANVTHELRTPVNGIKGHIKNLYNSEPDQEKRRTLDIVIKCCENMEKIISNFLDFSKIEAGKFEINEASFNFRDCINHVIDTSMVIANEKGIKLMARVAEDIPECIIGDELRIVQVLNNLVSNALKFTSIGYVSVDVYKTRLKHGRMELTFFVTDTGIGVSLEEKEKMFKSFSQVDGSITRKYGGTGLGLYVTRQLIELMHGDISLESEKGKGSTFSFNIEVGVEGDVSDSDAPSVNMDFLTQGGLLFGEMESLDKVYVYGTEENIKEINTNIEKLSLCIDMGNWEKAEFFSDTIKSLTQDAERDIKSMVLKLQMSVRKEDYDKSMEMLKAVRQIIA
ncbi:MAG: hypothetical protein IJB96_11970 [Lachnospira sp.]|nr:hypothetical protein [Lachnospira sp.]